MQRLLPVALSGPNGRAQANAALDAEVAAIHRASRGSYGRPRIARQLRAQGQTASAERVRRSLQRHGRRPVYKRQYRVTMDLTHRLPVAPNLLDLRFDGWRPNQTWAATSRSSGPARAGCIWQRSWIWRAGASLAGRCQSGSTQIWSVRRCAALAGNANRRRDSCCAPIAAVNMPVARPGADRCVQDKRLNEPPC